MNVISPPTRALLALSALKGVGPAALKKVAALPAFWELQPEDWALAAPQVAKALHELTVDDAWDVAEKWAENQVAEAERYGARIVSLVDDDYPKLLTETNDDPALLFVKGRLAENPRMSVAIIGTRESTQHGRIIAKRITQFFVEQQWSIVSGLAIGCDAIAHEIAIQLGGHTVAVLAHGLQMISPPRHKELAQEILRTGGALVSEYPFGKNVLGAQFVKRDRTQAGMSRGVVMVQSDLKGGSLHASRAALDYQRWLAVPYPTDRDRENGEPKIQANLLIADGTDQERVELLRCPLSSLRNVKVVRGRDDYLQLITLGEKENSSLASSPIASNTMREVPQPKSHGLSGLSRQIENHEIVSPAGVIYDLAVGPNDLSVINTSNFLRKYSRDLLRTLSRTVDGKSFPVMLRLTHLEKRVEEINATLGTKHLNVERDISRVHFQIEELLMHMRLTLHELLGMNHGQHGKELLAVRIAPHPEYEEEAFSMKEMNVAVKNVLLVDVLDQLVNRLPDSVCVYDHADAREHVPDRRRVIVHFGDVMFSFVKLLEAAFLPRPKSSHVARAGN